MKALIFDMDGVIIDSEPIHFAVDEEFLKRLGVHEGPEYMEQFVGMRNPDIWKRIAEEHQLSINLDAILEEQRVHKVQLIRETPLEPIFGIRELINELLARDIPFGLASSSPRALIEAVLEKFEILHAFRAIVSGEEVPLGKPAPDIYLKAASLLGIAPSNCVVIEDAHHGVIAAKRAGMMCIGFQNMHSGAQDLSKADWVVDSIREVTVSRIMERMGAH
ncbi:HAD family hydrolase [Ferroacidibacillus organovorans]|nr:HAD family phosphatase [Ferroacidibacillus organovorans]